MRVPCILLAAIIGGCLTVPSDPGGSAPDPDFDETAFSEPETPAPDPGSADSVPYEVRLADLEARVEDLKERNRTSRARIESLRWDDPVEKTAPQGAGDPLDEGVDPGRRPVRTPIPHLEPLPSEEATWPDVGPDELLSGLGAAR
jgi:hypothetical protein